VERRSGEPLAEDSLALSVDLLLERVGNPFELRGGEVGEEREPRDLVDDLVAAGHGDAPSVAVCAQRTAHLELCHRRGPAVDEQGARSQHHPRSTMEDPLTLTHDRRTELLAGCRLFSGVAPPDLAAVAGRAIEVDFPANHVIARQGEIGTGFFLIVSGSVKGRPRRRRGRGPGAGRLLR
jgi:hypothetical protein